MPSGRRLTDLEPAGFVRRASAFLLDILVAGVLLVLLLQLVLDPLRVALGPGWARVGWFYLPYALLTISLPMWLYFAGYESGARGATPGKRWLRIAVTSTAAAPLTFGRALLRTVLKLLPFETAHLFVALPANPFIDPLSGQLVIPALDTMGASVLTGLLLALLLLGAWVFTVMLHPDGRGPHDLLAHSFVVLDPEARLAPAGLAAPPGTGVV